ncbi:hypothetical protein V7S43_001162 [Phytophthora oleae]|uniref:Uncharacterized protein n=1 Tax=Phytophthora oleae TaxID=2107226 RepID=A0ABD3G6A2_9STRA
MGGSTTALGHTLNVKDHLVAVHSEHPSGKAESGKRVKRNRKQIEGVRCQPFRAKMQRTIRPEQSSQAIARKGVLLKLLSELNALIARWLISSVCDLAGDSSTHSKGESVRPASLS